MAGTTTAPAAGLRAVRAAALQRHEARRNPYQPYTEAEERRAWVEGRTLPRQDIYAPAFRPPETAAELFDDLVIAHSQLEGCPETAVLVGIAAAARDGAAAAVRAVKAARELSPAEQWVACQNLMRWRQGDVAARTGAERVVNAVLGEWERLGLAAEDPDGE